jgi:hypothetical protein
MKMTSCAAAEASAHIPCLVHLQIRGGRRTGEFPGKRRQSAGALAATGALLTALFIRVFLATTSYDGSGRFSIPGVMSASP